MARASGIKGLLELQRKLDAIPAAAKEHIRKEMAIAADQIVAAMKAAAPVLKEPHTKRRAGALRDSIGWVWGRDVPKGATILQTVRSKIGGDLTISIYAGNSAVRYAHLVEYGTKNPNYPAQPFFIPTWISVNKGRGNPKARVRRAIRDAARQVAKGG